MNPIILTIVLCAVMLSPIAIQQVKWRIEDHFWKKRVDRWYRAELKRIDT